ncbi:MAG TPA: DUF3606 domain-containing protein [Burkholderiales bacterium]|nr:DUF3606 domain-containing protein [Burkholderiales bacterium]
MPEAPSAKQPADTGQVNLHEEWELAYWVKLLGASEDDLRHAVQAVGPKTDAVKAHLGKRHTQK